MRLFGRRALRGGLGDAVVVALAVLAYGGAVRTHGAAPALRFPDEIDAGVLARGTRPTLAVDIRNETGTAIVLRVVPSCSCLVPERRRIALDPGETRPVPFQVVPEARPEGGTAYLQLVDSEGIWRGQVGVRFEVVSGIRLIPAEPSFAPGERTAEVLLRLQTPAKELLALVDDSAGHAMLEEIGDSYWRLQVRVERTPSRPLRVLLREDDRVLGSVEFSVPERPSD